MKVIDADELRLSIRDDDEIDGWNFARVRAHIEEAKALETKPIVYAHWDENGRCTNCGGHAPYHAMASTYYKSPYCFECGAKMN